MVTTKQKIAQRQRPQIFRDHGYAVIEAALAKQEDKLAIWLQRIMHDLARVIRKTGGRKRSVGSVHRAVGIHR